jgi:hypothetical protein
LVAKEHELTRIDLVDKGMAGSFWVAQTWARGFHTYRKDLALDPMRAAITLGRVAG